MSDPVEVAAQIRAGVFDGHLADIQAAMRDRVLSQATSMRWQVTHPQVTVREDDLTLGEAEMIERVTGQTWGTIDPYTSARECRAILTVCLQQRTDLTAEQASKMTADLPASDVVGMLSTYEVVGAPLAVSVPGEPAV